MSIEEDRQVVAKLLGGSIIGDKYNRIYVRVSGVDTLIDTLDGIASLWPKEWTWKRYVISGGLGWIAIKDGPFANTLSVHDTGNELADRTRLLRLVLEASIKKGNIT